MIYSAYIVELHDSFGAFCALGVKCHVKSVTPQDFLYKRCNPALVFCTRSLTPQEITTTLQL